MALESQNIFYTHSWSYNQSGGGVISGLSSFLNVQVCIQKFEDSACKKEIWLTWMLNSSITFKVLPFCTSTTVPSFLPCLEASLDVPFWNSVKYPLRFLFNLFSVCRIVNPLSEASAWGRGKSHRGPDQMNMGGWVSLSCCSWPKTGKV